MRISDWSSDVCSSDLVRLAQIGQRLVATDVERAEHHRPVAGRLQHIAIEPGLPLAAGKRCRDEELEFGPEMADPFGTRRVERAEVVPEARIDQQGDWLAVHRDRRQIAKRSIFGLALLRDLE